MTSVLDSNDYSVEDGRAACNELDNCDGLVCDSSSCQLAAGSLVSNGAVSTYYKFCDGNFYYFIVSFVCFELQPNTHCS